MQSNKYVNLVQPHPTSPLKWSIGYKKKPVQVNRNVNLSRLMLCCSFSREEYETFLLTAQGQICNEVTIADGSSRSFCSDKWLRGQDPSNGYGITRVIEDGNLLEKGAVNVSIVHGQLSEARAKAMSARGQIEAGCHYFAGALSLVFHPQNPYVPTFRADVRYFEIDGGSGWFGGGADLTPCYLDIEDAEYFHHFLKQICDKYDPSFYSQCKSKCDAYFYIPVRKQHRGIGGIFFDDLEYFKEQSGAGDKSLLATDRKEANIQDNTKISGREKAFRFIKELAEGFTSSFLPIANKSRFRDFGKRQKEWQLLQRGRYLEFNLLYDRGIKFGLDGGRIESIMVSAPPLVSWKYDKKPISGSPEAEMLQVLCKPREWIRG
ncbi:hypothetical protein SUGI_0949930 [Cryptomeria japonica]|nr:hypothetical protein SUGI_0949930 [Cryptomeria japonica]